jgi:malate dehydrogenase (oxaloacetate-decarboxylating)
MGRLAQLHGQHESLEKILTRTDMVICTTGAQHLVWFPPELIRQGQIVFALSTPDPEINPATALAADTAVAADGKSINSVLCFPGLFDAALRARARSFTDSMLVAAANALAAASGTGQPLPDPLDVSVHERVSVQAAIIASAPASLASTSAPPPRRH